MTTPLAELLRKDGHQVIVNEGRPRLCGGSPPEADVVVLDLGPAFPDPGKVTQWLTSEQGRANIAKKPLMIAIVESGAKGDHLRLPGVHLHLVKHPPLAPSPTTRV